MKYVRLVQWSAKQDTILLEMLGEDQKVHRLEVSSECAGLLVAALASELEKLGVADKEHQFIRPTGMQTAKTAQGEPLVFMALKGGGELPLVFKPETLGPMIAELESLQRALEPGGQIRWR